MPQVDDVRDVRALRRLVTKLSQNLLAPGIATVAINQADDSRFVATHRLDIGSCTHRDGWAIQGNGRTRRYER